VIDGEDVVQDTLAKALQALATLESSQSLRAWLFRIAHNSALDFIRSRAVRAAEPLEAAGELEDLNALDALEATMRQEAVRTAVSRFVELPTAQRSVIILKDVLGHSLEEIAAMLETSVNGVKGHLARGRSRLKEINREPRPEPVARASSPMVSRYATLFNSRDWQGLRAMLAADVKLNQATHPLRAGAADVGMFFSIYSRIDSVRLVPAWLEGREVIAVFEGDHTTADYLMRLEWRNDRITFIQDYRYARYVLECAELAFSKHN